MRLRFLPLFSVLAAGSLATLGATVAPRPNIIFILADDLGWSDLTAYGSTFHETPNLDRLAAQGVRFTQAYAACSVCSPTRASLLTGFVIAGADRVWHPAAARTDGDHVVLSSIAVPAPVAARYGWANNPACNLYNRADLPLAPFRTDAW